MKSKVAISPRVLRSLGYAAAFVGSAAVVAAALYYQSGIPKYELPPIPSEAIEQTVGPARGPLAVSSENPRYFADPSGTLVLLAGAHTWGNLQDNGIGDPPPVFDYEAFLDFLVAHNINFFRLWVWEQARWGPWSRSDYYYFYPGPPYERTGPGLALDGKPRFDLDRLRPEYFARLRERVDMAGSRGVYVAIMLFNGWAIDNAHSNLRRGNPWLGHPFNRENNVNGVDGDPNGDMGGDETHQLMDPEILGYQEAYVRAVIDAVNDLDNVLYEISNESYSNSRDWQYHMINFIKEYEATKPQQHPVGMSQYQWPGSNEELLASPADWIAPWEELPNFPYLDDPRVATGQKVVIVDTDHLWGIGGDRKWAWKTFLRGNQPSFMDAYDGAAVGLGAPAGWDIREASFKRIVKDLIRWTPRPEAWNPYAEQWVELRLNLGFIRSYASRIDLKSMLPRPDLSSTEYCLADTGGPNATYLIYSPGESPSFEVDLSGSGGRFAVEWFDPATGSTVSAAPVNGGTSMRFTAPFDDDSVLLLSPSSPN